MYRIGIIGLGKRFYEGVLESFFSVTDEIRVTAVADPAVEKIREKISAKPEFFSEDVKVYSNADELLSKEELDGIMIGTRCSLHTPLAVKVMKKNIPIYLEKPVSINEKQLIELREAAKKYNPRVVVSFPLRFSDVAVKAKEIIDSGEIGEVLQVDAFNDVPYGRVYFHTWYRDENETGGLWLQKATHDFDYLNYILADTAEEVFAMSSRKLFKGDMPAGLMCKDCPKIRTCTESPLVVRNASKELDSWMCCFAEDTGNEDCSNALVKYSKGTIVNYSQNFFARNDAARRGARFYGYKGTLDFDWYKSEIKVYMHQSPRVDTYTFKDDGESHFGGDNKLAKMFLSLLAGENSSYLDEGIRSALMCLSAKKSCEINERVKIEL